MSLITGSKIFLQDYPICDRCGKPMDPYGYHALHCPVGGWVTKRHDKVCDTLGGQLKRAGFNIQFEARYHRNENGELVRRKERPGDILIHNWDFGDEKVGKLYIDVTVGNIFAESYVNECALKRLSLAEKLAKRKNEKYKNRDDIRGLGLECLGGMCKEFKAILQRIAEAMELRSGVARSIWMNRIRSRLMIELMMQNAKLIRTASSLVPDDVGMI